MKILRMIAGVIFVLAGISNFGSSFLVGLALVVAGVVLLFPRVKADFRKVKNGATSSQTADGFGYSGGPVFGPWDTSIHAAPGQYARFGRAVARPLSPFSKGGENTKLLDFDGKAGFVKVQGRKDRVYTVSLDRCTCPDFQERGLPCKHIYGLAIMRGYTARDYWASWLDVACSDGVITRPASGYSNGVFRYDVRGVNPETGRKNKRTVSACGEEDAVAAAHEIGLSDPVEVLPLDMAAQNIRPADRKQKEFAVEYQVAFAPDFDEKDAAAVLSRYDREDTTGIPVGLLQFVTRKRLRVSLLSSAWGLSFLVFEKLSLRDVLALYAASVRLCDAGSSLTEATQDPVDAACYAFSDASAGAEWVGELSPRELLQPIKGSPSYRAARSFLRSFAG